MPPDEASHVLSVCLGSNVSSDDDDRKEAGKCHTTVLVGFWLNVAFSGLGWWWEIRWLVG